MIASVRSSVIVSVIETYWAVGTSVLAAATHKDLTTRAGA